VDGTDRSAYSAQITGLQSATSYRVRGYVKTTLDGTTVMAYSDVITCTTVDLIPATVGNVTTSLTEDCTISVSSGISDLGTGVLIEKGFCWKMGSAPTLDDCDGYKAVTDGSDESYSVSITGLRYNHTYYICAYSKTDIDGETFISYSSTSTRATRSIGLTYDIKLSDDYIEISMSCDDNFTNKMTDWSMAIVKEGNSEIAINDASYVTAEKNADTGKYVAKLTDLSSDITYVVRLRVRYNNEYYIYQDTESISLLKGPSLDDIDDPEFK
jgi:hypothetical protein